MIGFLVHNSEKYDFFRLLDWPFAILESTQSKILSLSTVARCSVIDTVRFTVKNKELPFVIEIVFVGLDGKYNRYLFFPQPIPHSSIHDLVFVVFAVCPMNSSYNLFPVQDNTLILWYHSEVIKLCAVYPVAWIVVILNSMDSGNPEIDTLCTFYPTVSGHASIMLFPSSLGPLYQSEVRCPAFDM